MRRVSAVALAGVLAALVMWKDRSRPGVVLWLWERPEDVRSVPGAAFAILCGSFRVTDHGTEYRPRLQPVQLPDGAATIAVFRIDVGEGAGVPAEAIARQILKVVPPDVRGVQIDFDARVSERASYRELLRRLRRDLPHGQELSMTALASWCLDDPWIRDLPVDEAVPMLFQMGPDGRQIRQHVERGGSFRVPLCNGSAGLSLAEPVMRVPNGVNRIYMFSPGAWNEQSAAKAMNVGAWL